MAKKKRGPGRPKGSKNKTTKTAKKRGPGRPKGSKNKKVGRPKGSSKTVIFKGTISGLK